MIQSFEKRYWDLNDEVIWKPEIYMPNTDGIITDFVPFIVPTVSQQIAFLGMGFPDKASFCFYGYNGIEDKERVIDDIKKSAFGSGSKLRSSFRGKSFQTRNRLCTVDFFCVRHKPFKDCGIYNQECIQAVGTILQKEHQSKSRQGIVANEVVSAKDCETSTEETPKKRKRRTTSISPSHKESCCPFGFMIFCSDVDKRWYLSCNTRYVMKIFSICYNKL